MNGTNEITERSSVTEWDLTREVKALAQTIKNLDNNKHVKERPEYFALTVCAALDYLNRRGVRGDRDLDGIMTKDYAGGYLSESTYKALGELGKVMAEHIDRDYINSHLSGNIEDTGVMMFRKGKNYGRLMSKSFNPVGIYGKSDKDTGIYALTASFRFDRSLFENVFVKYQIRDLFDDDEDDDDIDQDEIREKKDAAMSIRGDIRVAGVVKLYLQVWVLGVLAAMMQKQTDITDDDKAFTRMFVERVRGFVHDFDGELKDNVLDRLPVIPKITPESLISSKERGDFREYTFDVVMKLNRINSSSDANIPVHSCQDEINHVNDGNVPLWKVSLWQQVFFLMYQIDTGERYPDTRNITKVVDAMKSYRPSFDYDRLARIFENMDTSGLDETVRKYIFQKSVLHKEDVVKQRESPFMINWTTYFGVADVYKDGTVPVMFSLRRDDYVRSSSIEDMGRTYITQGSEYAGLGLYEDPDGRAEAEYNRYNGDGRYEDRVKAASFDTADIGASVYPQGDADGPFQNGRFDRMTADRWCLYDIMYCILATAYVHTAYNGRDHVDLLMPRVYCHEEEAGDENADRAGSRQFMTALGYALEQGLSTEHLSIHTQGQVFESDRMKNDQYKLWNASSSILASFPCSLDMRYDNAIDRTGLIFFTTYKADSDGSRKDQMSMLSTSAMEYVGGRMRCLPSTNELCSSRGGNGKDEKYDFGSERRFYDTIRQMKADGTDRIIMVMDAPFSIDDRSAARRDRVLGISRENLLALENNEEFTGITFIPLYFSEYQVKTAEKDDFVISDVSREHDADRVSLCAFALAPPVDGYRNAPVKGYRSGGMYQTYRDYYAGQTGKYIDAVLIKRDTSQEGGYNGLKEMNRLFLFLMMVHLLSNEKNNGKDGKKDPFSRLKTRIMPKSVVTYTRPGGNRYSIHVNYLALVNSVVNVLNRKGEDDG